MERNEITAEISILELDHEEIFIRKEEGSPNSLSNMLNAAVTQLFIEPDNPICTILLRFPNR